ncbi:hypothetical protein L198_05854 [Cryptococcus wingfieldii CBS 7118]|uniref:BTB domain-containing protein n=1 Tax=Cryptococcus wingfieldii CBS 7118 TaxID=1295528 RepID=A0A1E3IRU4_9TREE|nr:hypothetical protein L198_05854 [Cryptococcus wingfieldii CBS 7118]ODN91343.1 hypothetical protein L198_05854 [Cryptococcus wingfieldii CBS 7118]
MSKRPISPPADGPQEEGRDEPHQSRLWPPISQDSSNEAVTKIISADDVELYVPEHLLRSHSVVFRTMLNDIPSPPPASGNSHPIELTDPKIEGHKTLHLFLAIVTGEDLKDAVARDQIVGARGEMLLAVMRFAEKWDCPIATRLLTFSLMELAGKGLHQRVVSRWDIFVIAAQMGLPEIAAKVIEVYRADIASSDPEISSYPPPSWPIFLGAYPEFAISSLKPEAWGVIPSHYLHALYRASTTTALGDDNQDWCENCN